MGKDISFGGWVSSKIDNHKQTIAAASNVTYHIMESGSDTSSDIYFDFERQAEQVTIRATVVCSITELNGKTLKSPLTINPGTNTIGVRTSRFKLVTTAQSVVEVTIK